MFDVVVKIEVKGGMVIDVEVEGLPENYNWTYELTDHDINESIEFGTDDVEDGYGPEREW